MTAAATVEARRDEAILRQAGSGRRLVRSRLLLAQNRYHIVCCCCSRLFCWNGYEFVCRRCSLLLVLAVAAAARARCCWLRACCSCSPLLMLLVLAVAGSGCLPGMGIARPARGPRAGNVPLPPPHPKLVPDA